MTADEAAPHARATPGDAGDRGRLDIDRSVLRAIAEHSSDLVSGSVRVRRVARGEHGALARLSGPVQELRVRLEVALRYPAPIRDTVGEIRERVSDDLQRLAGCHVRRVDVTVSALVPAREPARVE